MLSANSRDPAIKLFGKTIALPLHSEEGGGDDDKGSPKRERSGPEEAKDREQESPISQGKTDTESANSATDDTQKHSSDDQESSASASDKDPKSGEQQQGSDSGGGMNPAQEKPLKKPDKILPCPRCSSMDTKFCYYNNYNVNQPRHFCKNCQRYWTAGGTMRNVPVGAGRRKNKNSAVNHYRHLTMTDAAAAAALQAIPDQIHHQHALTPNGTVLSFGSDTPLCESMASVLNLAEKAMRNCNRNGFHPIEEGHMEEQSSGSSNTIATACCNSADGGPGGPNLQEAGVPDCQGFNPHHHLPYINGLPWPYPWNPPPPPPCSGAAPPPPPFYASSFPIPIYPPAAAYWGCGAWSIPWLAPLASPPTPSGGSSGSGPNSPTLGKHSRDGNVLTNNNNNRTSSEKGACVKQSNQEKCLWIPKTLRIDDPEEAAKSSIWATMGFKNDKSAADGLFKSFRTKAELNNHKVGASPLLHTNPAALSRSINFQESS